VAKGRNPAVPVQRVAPDLPHWIDGPNAGMPHHRLSLSEIDRAYFGPNEGDPP